MSNKKIKYKLACCFIMLFFQMSGQNIFAQLINNGAKIVVKQGATISSSSRVDNRNNGTITNDGTLLIKGSLNHFSGTFTNNKEVTLLGNLLANSTFTNSQNSAFRLTGNLQQVAGTNLLSFWDLFVGTPFVSPTGQKVGLNQNIAVRNQLNLVGLGYINLNGKFIDLGTTGSLVGENSNNRIREEAKGGYIQATRRTNPFNIAGLGLSLQSDNNLGEITVRRGHDLFVGVIGNSMKRYFDVTASNAITPTTKLLFQYFNEEISQTPKAAFALSNSQDEGKTWTETQSYSDVDGRLLSVPIVANAQQANRWTAFEQNTAQLQATLKSSIAGVVCSSEKLQLEATDIAGATYTWSGPNGFKATGRTPVIDFSPNLKSGDYVVTANISSSVLTASVSVKISSGTDFDVVVKDVLCQNNKDGTIKVTSKSGLPLSFKIGANGTPQIGVSVEFANLAQGDYTIFATDDLGCQTTKMVSVKEQTQILVDAGKDVAIIKGSSVQLQASGVTTYRWEPAIGLDNPNIANPIATPDITTLYKVFGSTAQGCESSDEVLVTVTSMTMPDRVLSPNGDGINDLWVIKDINLFPNSEVSISDRRGIIVFSATGYQNNWDGKGDNGPLPDATYYFVVKFDETNIVKGTLTIIR
ncbi:MAG: gliding motility-associated C-terminal domain-containing protein [Cytophagales bacterium]|nr:MAG: gliding motility-associated C-terminal domain-containing protein [Cytophagales bacterium]